MKDYTIKIVMVEHELKALKNALKSYKGEKNIMSDLLHIIERQESEQNEQNTNKIENAC